MTDTTPPFDPAAHGWEPEGESGYAQRMGGFWCKPDGEAMLYGLLTDAGHLNRNGRIHGGVILGLADHALGHTSSHFGQTEPQATVQMDVQFMAAPHEGDFLVSRGTVVKMTRTLVFMRADITAGERMIASVSGVWKILGA